MKSQIQELSVFFPTYNEEGNIVSTINQAVEVLNKLKIEYEILIIDDGSSDQTPKIVDDLAQKNRKIRVIHHQKNLGYGSALKTGFKNAKYSWVAFADSDGQFNFNEIKLFLDQANEHDLVLGYRLTRADSTLRKLFTFGWGMIAKILLGLQARDYSCGFKLIKKEVFEKVQPLEGEEKVTQIELLVKARRLGFRFAEVGVHHYPRKFGIPTGAKVTVVMKSLFDLFKLWWQIKEQKVYFFALIAILALAAVMRFYRLSAYMTFLGDEGRDAIIIKNMLVDGHIPFIGPPTSVGNIYLGPLYYYMMAVSMAIFWLNPVAAAGMVACLSIITIILIYYLGKVWFGRMAGLIAALLYSISPVVITYSRSSWNPNPAPFFALLVMLGMYKSHQNRDFRWFILTGVALAFVVQMHYLALLMIPIIGILWGFELWLKVSKNKKISFFARGTVLAILGFILLMSPLILFDFKHDFTNYRALTAFFSDRETTVNLNPLNSVIKVFPIYGTDLISRYMTAENLFLTIVVAILVLMPLIILLYRLRKHQKVEWAYGALGVWLVVGVFGLSLYKQSIFDHYLGFLSPVPFLLLGGLLGNLKSRKLNIVSIILIVSLVGVNLQKSPILSQPGNELERTQIVAHFIIANAGNKPFNFALLANSNYDAAYQFYLDIYGHKPLQVPFDITDQLFVVCEYDPCQPVNNAKYEIAAFGWVKIAWVKSIAGVKVYKLIHNPNQP